MSDTHGWCAICTAASRLRVNGLPLCDEHAIQEVRGILAPGSGASGDSLQAKPPDDTLFWF